MDELGNAADANTPPPAIVLEDVSKRYRLKRRRRRWPFAGNNNDGDPSGGEDDDDEDGGDDDEPADDDAEAIEEWRGDQVIWALRNVSLTIPQGTALGIIGGSGAGKSTLLRIIARTAPPTRGRAIVAGRVAPLLGNVSSLLEGDFTGRQNVRLVSRFYGIPHEIAERHIEQIFEFADLVPFIDTKVKRYSPGLQMRLAFSVMLHLEPDVILADGVLGVGDPEFKARSRDALIEAHRNGVTLLLASSNTAQVREVCDEVLWLEQGRVVAHGSPDDIVEQFDASSGRNRRGRGAPAGPTVRAKRTRVVEAGFYSMNGDALDSVADGAESLVELTVVAPRPTAIAWAVEFAHDGAPCLRLVQPRPVEAEQRSWYRASMYVPAGALPDGAIIRQANAILVDEPAAGAEESVRASLLRLLGPATNVPEQQVEAWSWEPQPRRR